MNTKMYRTEKVNVEEVNKNYILEYYLIDEERSFNTGNINYMCYGVEIRMREENADNYCESQTADKLFSSKDLAINFLTKLADCHVTPCTLEDVVSDHLIEALV